MVVPAKETNKICLFFIFFRVVAPSSSLSRTLANSRLGFSISLRVLGNLDFFLFFYRKPAQLLSRDFHRLCDVVVVVVCPFTDRPTDIRRVNNKKQQNKKTKQKTHRFLIFVFVVFHIQTVMVTSIFRFETKNILFGLF